MTSESALMNGLLPVMKSESEEPTRPHISVSQLNMYLRCPAQYMFKYIYGIKTPARSFLIKGKAIHKGIEHNFRQKKETHQDIKLAEVLDITTDEFDHLRIETKWTPDEKPDQIRAETIELATMYHTKIAPFIQPDLIEERITISFDELDWDLTGVIDLGDKQGFIHDTKTAKKSPTPGEADKSLQLTAYYLLYRAFTGKEPAGCKLDYLVQTKNPKVVSLESKRTEREIARFRNIARTVITAIDNGNFYPNPNNMMCSEENCDYWGICHRDF
ncbi:RecB family exonuclease [Hydrogenispora ethanolica]|uniref:RecB family exonuclease n=1 Tax=Hydrogenispora ethanolica TaxID=1082276 RepID=A0A4R1S4K0_HYDET|nr:PD-(D/E)XK nuclease family protein [Hydrogenispora ethanolica]TCL74196.1 RecB family exonuclease [Hydrogenispora ethanolica]